MKFYLRFIIPLALVLCVLAYVTVPLVDQLTLKWFVRDLDVRTKLITNSIEEGLVPLLKSQSKNRINHLFNRIIQDERLYGIGFCDLSDRLLYRTQTLHHDLKCAELKKTYGILEFSQGPLHVSSSMIQDEQGKLGYLILLHDLSFFKRRSADTQRYILYFFASLALIISLITVVVAQISWKGWISGLRSIIRGEGLFRPLAALASPPPELKPVLKDLRRLVHDLETNRKARDEGHMSWSPKAIKDILRRDLAGDEVLVVSNREPYMHVRKEGKVTVQSPASGVVTALEPILRACSGTWIAHGSGNADREVVDSKDHVRVPPDNPAYQIRRVWLNQQEEEGYYYGFSNEGIWPLCHIAHVRPIFRTSDWNQYVAVNKKFADVVIQEAKTEDPVILVQDYHFALLPKMVREKLPQATIITFWHIPWPNPEAFGICPWREEILEGLLGSSILGFHTRFHCNNFIDTVDRYLECRVDHEHSSISFQGKTSMIHAYPISIEWPNKWAHTQKSVAECRAKIEAVNGFSPSLKLGLGIDRLDYTKGILERMNAVERLLELFPEWRGKFTFIQIGAPTRSSIEQYQNFEAEVCATAQRINRRFGTEGYQPICLKIEHHESEQVFEYYRGVDLCFVSSLHDGMNLVAKEFIAARDDEKGVLILSQFTGAARELPEALIVNPYNIDLCANALKLSLEMPENEQRDRMRSMRGLIQEYNVYRWAGRMLIDASRMRQRSRLIHRIRETGTIFST